MYMRNDIIKPFIRVLQELLSFRKDDVLIFISNQSKVIWEDVMIFVELLEEEMWFFVYYVSCDVY